jgi:hypothetical protein
MAIRLLQRQRSPEAVLSALVKRWGISRRQAHRYLLEGRSDLQPRVVPEAKTVFTVNLPRRLIQDVRDRCHQEGRAISQVVAEVLERWLAEASPHG